MDAYREYVGNLHVHSIYSDGRRSHKQIVSAAAEAGLDFVVVTDHNIHPHGLEGYFRNTLLLVGEELHNVQRQPQVNHLLVYGAEQEMAPFSFTSSQTLIDTSRKRGGICYLAHPHDRRGRIMRSLPAIPWVDWPLKRIHGLEIWNYMSEFKGLLWSWPAALFYALVPAAGIRGPYRATLRLWDELLNAGQRLAALGNSDAHGYEYRLGPLKRTLFPYRHLFRCVNTHILTQGPLVRDIATDRAMIYEALRAGRTWVGYDLPRSTRGFRFQARSGAASAVPGEELKRLAATIYEVDLPGRGEIHLLRNGKRVARARGQHLRYTSVEPGVYRVEVYARYRGRKVGWIFSSPIYVA